MDLELLQQLIQLLEDSEIDEMEIEQEGFRVSLKKHGGEKVIHPSTVSSVPQVGFAPVPEHPSGAEQKPEQSEGQTINAPMVGTFYRAPAPDSPSYVEIGDKVSEDTVICILEAMKVMNEIKAGMKGEIVEVLAENAQPVEYGQPLFRVKPASVQ